MTETVETHYTKNGRSKHILQTWNAKPDVNFQWKISRHLPSYMLVKWSTDNSIYLESLKKIIWPGNDSIHVRCNSCTNARQTSLTHAHSLSLSVHVCCYQIYFSQPVMRTSHADSYHISAVQSNTRSYIIRTHLF